MFFFKKKKRKRKGKERKRNENGKQNDKTLNLKSWPYSSQRNINNNKRLILM